MPIAKRPEAAETFLKVIAWGGPGSGKTRLALSFPRPLVLDLEKSTRLYARQYDYLIAEPSKEYPITKLVAAVYKEVQAGEYPDRETLIIDPITDYLDALEEEYTELKRQAQVQVDNLKGPQKAQFYSGLKDYIRVRLNLLLQLPMHIVLTAREKNLWKGTEVVGKQPDAHEIVTYLPDMVLKMQHGGTAQVEKSRLGGLPPTIRAMTFEHIREALEACVGKADPAPVVASLEVATGAVDPTLTTASRALDAETTTAAPTTDGAPDLMDEPSITAAQIKALGIECNEKFGTGKENEALARAWVSRQVGREIVSRKALTQREAERILRFLANMSADAFDPEEDIPASFMPTGAAPDLVEA